MSSEAQSNTETVPWVKSVFAALELDEQADAGDVMATANPLASKLAPNTRQMWLWIMIFEGIAVLVPLLWLMVLRLELPAMWIAFGVVLCTLTTVGFCWWLRWKGMQQTWTRTRLLGEIARSVLAVKGWPGNPTKKALEASPKLLPLADMIVNTSGTGEAISLDAKKQAYLANRIDDQVSYYSQKSEEASKKRKRISKVVTMCLDGALFFAVGGLIVGLSSLEDRWVHRWLQLSFTDLILGMIGASLPLIAIIYQSFGFYEELGRRTGRYRQQVEFLNMARARLDAASTLDEAQEVVQSVERVLLAEVIEWYYEMDNTENFYRSRKAEEDEIELVKSLCRNSAWSTRILNTVLSSLGFATRVLIPRVIVVALAIVVTTAWISFQFANDKLHKNILRVADGQLLASAKPEPELWDPQPEDVKNGFILIAHGLVDSALKKEEGNKEHWMTEMQNSLSSRLSEDCPNICLVDWAKAASPAQYSADRFWWTESGDPGDVGIAGWIQNITKIRRHAQDVGDLVGYKLVRTIKEGKLKSDKPMHFIGHSAGGFVVVRAALVLQSFDMLPESVLITMLDTPMPDWDDLEQLVKSCKVEFFYTSALAVGVPEPGFHENYQLIDLRLKVPEGIDQYKGAHSYAHQWYIRSVKDKSADGFGHSPFAR